MDVPIFLSDQYRTSILNNRDKFYIRLPPATIFSFPLTSTFYRIQCLRFMESRFTPGSVPYRILNEIKKDDIDPAQLSLSSTILIATKLLKQRYNDYGFGGLYQGFFAKAMHTIVRDLLVFILSKLPSISMPVVTDFTSPAATDNDIIKSGLRWIRRNKKHLNELFLTLFSEVATYPLLLCSTRLIIYDGNQPLSMWQMLQMTYDYEGFWALYKGIIPHLFCTITTYLRNPQYHSSVMAHNTNITMDIFNMLMSISNSHIMQLSTTQRCFSPIKVTKQFTKGLCTHTDTLDLIRSIGWKGVALQLCLGSFLIGTKEYTTSLLFSRMGKTLCSTSSYACTCEYMSEIMSMEMDTQYNCKIYIPNQTNEYTHNYYTTSLSVPNRTLERSQLSNGLIENIEQEMIEYRNNKFEDRYVAFESNLSEMQHDRIIRDDHSTTPYRRAECPIHVYDRDGVPSRRGNDLNSTKDRKGDEMINYKTFGNSCSNMGREVEDKLNRLIAERVVDGNDNWPLVQIPLEIKYEVFRRRRKGDATNEWSNAYDTTQDPLQCNMPDPECDNEPICC